MEFMEQEFFNPCTPANSKVNLSRTVIPNIPKEIIFPDELNRYLKNQIQYLAHENGMLKKNLAEIEIEMKQSKTQLQNLNMKVEKYDNNIDSKPVGAASKIVELSKKLREKTSELEVYKTKCAKLEYQIQLQKHIPEIIAPIKERSADEFVVENKNLNDKINHLKTKLIETRNSNAQLKNDIKLANKLLVQEVGETFESIQGNVSANPNWRGRSQIITDLLHKNTDLREKMRKYEKGFPPSLSNDNCSQTKAMYEKRLENLTTENGTLKTDLLDMKKKLEGSRARCKVLDTECAVYKSKIGTIHNQNEMDRDLISTLTAQISNTQNNQNEMLKTRDGTIEKLQKNIKEVRIELKKETCRSEHLLTIIHERDNEIKNFSTTNVPKSPRSPIQSPKMKNDQTLLRFEAERLRFLELSQLNNDRLSKERESRTKLESLYIQERQKAAKLEGKLARILLDHNTEKSSSYLSSKASTKEVDRRLEDELELAHENIKALETRLDIERHEREADLNEFSKIIRSGVYGGGEK